MEALSKFFAEIGRFWRRLGADQKVTLGVMFVVIVGLSAGLFVWSNRPDYVQLFSGLPAEDAWKVVEALNKENVPYQLTGNGGTVLVPAKDVQRLRISLAASGLPKKGDPGYEIFDGKSSFGVSDFVQQINYQRALEGELARTIAELSDVEHARVHLTLPKETLFQEDRGEGTASVVVALKDGAGLDEREVAGITHLVASSVPHLTADRVTVVDSRGRILTNPQDDAGGYGASRAELEIQRHLEEYLGKKAQSLLEGVLGTGRAMVKVNAELDFRRVDETKESYDPENVVVRSEERVEEQGDQTGPQNAERSITNYEINKSVQRILGATGTLRRLSVAVFVDGKMQAPPAGAGKNAQPTYQARTPADLETLTSLVKTAVGFDAARGDHVEVANLEFERDGFLGTPSSGGHAGGASAGTPAWQGTALSLLTKGSPFVILILVLVFLRKSMTGIAQAFAEKKDEIEQNLLPERAIDEVEARKLEIRTRVEALAVERPSEVATLIRNWMMEE